MNMKQHPANVKLTRAGHSIGRRDGDTLPPRAYDSS
jgi:hypothetical protein